MLLCSHSSHSVDQLLFLYQGSYSLLILSEQLSSFNIYYSSHLYEHVHRILIQFLRTLSQEDQFEDIEMPVGVFLIVMLNHWKYDPQQIGMTRMELL